MFTVGVREHVLIAHSLKGEVFGPAQNVHGCTYVVDAEFKSEDIDQNSIVIDIGIATKILKDTLAELNYKNLDNLPEFKNKNTTTEFLAKEIFLRIKGALKNYVHNVSSLKITLNESHVAWASYEYKI